MIQRFCLIIIICFGLFSQGTAQIDRTASYRPNEVIVKFKKGISTTQKNALQHQLQATSITALTSIKAELWTIPAVIIQPDTVLNDVAAVVDYYEHNPTIAYIEPNYIYKNKLSTNDPLQHLQWNIANEGQTGGLNQADIRAKAAWDIQKESPAIKVGVVDTGIDWKHPDLINNIWQNLAEDVDGDGRVLEFIDGEWVFDPDDIDEIDNDGNGYVDDFIGWDFLNNDNDPYDDRFHGTHVAGIIGADGNNEMGISGVTWDVQLVALKFLGADGSGATTDAIAALEYATQMGIEITNNSWGGGAFSNSLLDAITAAQQAGQLFIAAAGNDHRDIDVKSYYPASYDLDNIISVAATDYFDNLAPFSNYGASRVDLAAPGDRILSTIPDNQYGYLDGTSMAAPHVAGAAALMWAQCGEQNYSQIKEQLLLHTDPLPMLSAKCASGGRLNLLRALQAPNQIDFTPQNDGLTVSFTPTVSDALSYLWIFGDGEQSTEMNPSHTYTAANVYEICLTITTACNTPQVCKLVTVQDLNNTVATYTRSIHNNMDFNDIQAAVITTENHVVAVGNEFIEGRYLPIFYEFDAAGALIETFHLAQDFSAELTTDIVQTTDNGYAISGKTETSSGMSPHFFITKLDANKNLLWTRYIDDPLISSTTSKETIAATSDGGVIFTGINTSNTNTIPCVAKFSTQGTLEWSQNYSHPDAEASFITPTDILETSIGGYIVVGQVRRNDNQTDNFALSISATGAIEWWQIFGGAKDEAAPLVTTHNNNLLVVSSSKSFGAHQNEYDIYLVTLSANGTILQEKEFDFSNELTANSDEKNLVQFQHYIYGITPISDNNGFYLVGEYFNGARRKPLMAKIDNQLTINWLKVSDQFSSTAIHSAAIEKEGDLLALGTATVNSSQRALALQVSAQGTAEGCNLSSLDYNDIAVSSTATTTNLFSLSHSFSFGNLSWTKTARTNYITNTHCENTPCVADFTYAPESVCANTNPTNFTNTSQNLNTISSEWRIDGEIVATTQDFSHTFTEAGTYIVSLKIADNLTSCMTSQEITVGDKASEIDLGIDLRICGNETTLTTNIDQLAGYSWQLDNSDLELYTSSIVATQSGTYILDVFDACGNIGTASIEVALETCDVWTGDVNYDGMVDMQDVLFLGIKNGRTGFTRSNANLNWQAAPAPDWNDTTPDGIDAKHADCDGDGIVNIELDIAGIDNNYGKSHDLGQHFPADNLEGDIQLQASVRSLNFDNDGGTIEVDLDLKHLTGNNIDFYGLTFTADYNDLGDNAFIETTNSLLGEDGTQIFSFYKDLSGRSLEAAIIRIEGDDISTNAFGNRRICKFVIVDENIVTDTIMALGRMEIKLDNIHLIDHEGNVITEDVAGSTLSILFSPDYLAAAKNSSSNTPLAVAISSNYATCATGGTAIAQVMGGTAPFTYQWSDGTTSATTIGLTTGAHYLTVTDANQQQVSGHIIISGITPLATEVTTDNNDCTVAATSTGGAGEWSYLWSNNETTPTTTLPTGSHTVTVTDELGCQHVTDFSLDDNCAVLPLELLEFQVATQEEQIQLNWSTAHEYQILKYEIQRAINARDYMTIATQLATNENKSIPQAYQHIDKNLRTNQTYYYRIKIHEVDGTFTFSPIKSAQITTSSVAISFVPNPVSHQGILSLRGYPPTVAKIQIFNQLGQVIQQKNITASLEQDLYLDFSTLQNGVYFIQIQGTHWKESVRVIKI